MLSLFFFRFSQSQISVRLGEYDFTTQGETGEQTYTLSGMKMHENYDPKTFENDIAILKLSQDAQFTQSVQPACLPIGDSDYNNVKVNISILGQLIPKRLFGVFNSPKNEQKMSAPVG